MMKVLESEDELVRRLKGCCDQDGREIDLAKSTAIIHQLGLVYKNRSPNKICLIQSIGLLNAAIARDPVNVQEILKDLAEVCELILQLSGAKKVDLIEKAKTVKISINTLRSEVVQLLQRFNTQQLNESMAEDKRKELEKQKISAVQDVSVFIHDEYKKIMAELTEYCEDAMGKPPCNYSLAGMGSLARKEITPYSDFEHVLLMKDHENYEPNVEYFRWMSVIFHAIVLNLQETLVTSLFITSLDSWYFDAYTPKGISFDGMVPHACKFPLGRPPTDNKPWTTELIRPVSEMLKFLSSDEDLRNGYHLKDILTKTCHVFGDKKVYEQFEKGARSYLEKKTKEERIDDVKSQVQDDLDHFSARFRLASLKSFDSINIKKMVYRSSTLFIAAFATIYGISAKSCFGVINEMADANIISMNAKHKLSYAVSIACEMRLKVYMASESQLDIAIDLKQDRQSNIEKFLDIVGVENTISYFQIAYCLQCEIAKHLIFTKQHFYSNPLLINLAISLAFGTRSFNESLLKSSTGVWDISKFDFDASIKKIQASTENQDANLEEQIQSVALHLQSQKMYDEALELYQYLEAALKGKSKTRNNQMMVAAVLAESSYCLWRMHQYNDSLSCSERSLIIYQALSSNEDEDKVISKTLTMKGIALRELQRYEDTLDCWNRAYEILRNISSDPKKDFALSKALNNVGLVLRDLHRYESSLEHLKRSIEIQENISADQDVEDSLAKTSCSLGLCLQNLQRYDEALQCFDRTLKIFQKLTLDEDKDHLIAETLKDIGKCYIDMHQCDNALEHLTKSLKIYQLATLDQTKDRAIAEMSYNIGVCFSKMRQKDNAKQNFEDSALLYRKIADDVGEDPDVTEKLRCIDRSLLELNSDNTGYQSIVG